MQDKIQQAPPPEIKLFEGKPPPTSWVEENIVRFFQVRSQIEFLTDVVTYLQELQGEKLAQARPKPTLIKETFLPVPEKGSSEEVSQAATYNATQSYVKTQMEYLEKLISILQQGDPKLAPALAKHLEDLKQMARVFPNLTKAQTESLSQILQQLTEQAKQLPLPYRKAFWNAQLKMMQSLMADNGANLKDFQNEGRELHARSEMLSKLQNVLNELQNALQAKPPSRTQLQKLLEGLQTLANSNTQLNPEQSEALLSIFQQLNLMRTEKGRNLTQIAADSVIQTKLSAFLKSNPNASSAEVLAYLSQFLKESNLQNSTLPFMKSLGDSIEDILDQKGFPNAKGYSGLPFATQLGDQLKPNENMVDKILSDFALDPHSSKELDKTTTDFSATLTEEIDQNANKKEGYETTVETLKTIQNQLGKGALWGVGQSLAAGRTPPGFGAAPPGAAAPGASGGALPWQFERAILGHYMPGQEAYLEQLALFLSMDNMGAEFGNTLLNDMLNFGQAADNYDFSNGLHSSGTGFSGSYSQAKQQFANEKSQCSNDINHAKQARNDINSELAKIKAELNNPNLSPSLRAQYTKMQSSLESMLSDVNVAISQLQQLQSVLNTITISKPTPPQTPSKDFNVTSTDKDWQSHLSSAENIVINGDPKSKPPGGLPSLASQATNFQQKYSDQGQNMQMMLQMRMTEIQQEWTLVSSALTTLNQIYMSLAQSIYK